jgi:adenylate cyclase
MTKILVADDELDLELLIKQKFRKQIRDEEYAFVFAVNGRDALEKLEMHKDIDLVLSDINMPEVDGLTLLVKINENAPLLKTIIISAYGDMENIRTAMNRGAFDFLTKPIDFSDLETTIRKSMKFIQQARETLKAIRENNILRMYVDESVLQFMSRPEYQASLSVNEHIEASVAFIDICGFTAITENASAEDVVHLLNKYFDVMVQGIIAQQGHVDKFIGDCVMAVYRGKHHLDRAVESAITIRNNIEHLSKDSTIAGFTPRVSIGLNSGDLISGNIGSETLRRLDYTVIGDTVNTAQRLQSVAKPGQIIVSAACHELIKDSFKFESLGPVTLKNKANPVDIYNVIE